MKNTTNTIYTPLIEMAPMFPTFSQPHDPPDLLLLSDLARFSTFSVALYTHMLALYMNPCINFFFLLSSTCSTCWQHIWRHAGKVFGIKSRKTSFSQDFVEGDNPMGLNYAGYISIFLVYSTIDSNVHF